MQLQPDLDQFFAASKGFHHLRKLGVNQKAHQAA
jgi:hypothetical protein